MVCHFPAGFSQPRMGDRRRGDLRLEFRAPAGGGLLRHRLRPQPAAAPVVARHRRAVLPGLAGSPGAVLAPEDRTVCARLHGAGDFIRLEHRAQPDRPGGGVLSADDPVLGADARLRSRVPVLGRAKPVREPAGRPLSQASKHGARNRRLARRRAHCFRSHFHQPGKRVPRLVGAAADGGRRAADRCRAGGIPQSPAARPPCPHLCGADQLPASISGTGRCCRSPASCGSARSRRRC